MRRTTAPRSRRLATLARDAVMRAEAIVLGAGWLARPARWPWLTKGLAVTVVDALPQAAGASSGNPAGLFHGTPNPDDGPHARFNRAAALCASR